MVFFYIPSIYGPRNTLVLPPSSNSDPGSEFSEPFSPTAVRALIFIARIIQNFFPSSAGVELYLPTLLGALNVFFRNFAG